MTRQEPDQLQEKTTAQLKSGESLFEKDEAFVRMLKRFIEVTLRVEKDGFLGEEQ